MRTAVITIASGRHDHLRVQREGLRRGTVAPDLHMVVAIADPDLRNVVADGRLPASVVDQPGGKDRLPLAAARNRGAAAAMRHGAHLLIFLDVDCTPGPRLVERYREAAVAAPGELLSGPVAYLAPPPPGGYDLTRIASVRTGHPARPVPPEHLTSPIDHRLFWSLSFAVTTSTWVRIGGFCELYDGYGAEDTDFGQLAKLCGVAHTSVGGAWAYHQFHPVSDPPVEHVADIVRNSRLFHQRWGWFPMDGWLRDLHARGLVEYDALAGTLSFG
jgi:hypothetical protein